MRAGPGPRGSPLCGGTWPGQRKGHRRVCAAWQASGGWATDGQAGPPRTKNKECAASSETFSASLSQPGPRHSMWPAGSPEGPDFGLTLPYPPAAQRDWGGSWDSSLYWWLQIRQAPTLRAVAGSPPSCLPPPRPSTRRVQGSGGTDTQRGAHPMC